MNNSEYTIYVWIVYIITILTLLCYGAWIYFSLKKLSEEQKQEN